MNLWFLSLNILRLYVVKWMVFGLLEWSLRYDNVDWDILINEKMWMSDFENVSR